MHKSVFFIPADRQDFIKKIKNLQATDFVFDMEESVSNENRKKSLENLRLIEIKSNYGVRLPIDYTDFNSNKDLFVNLYNLGFRLFLLPKLNTLSDFESIIYGNISIGMKDIKYSITVETPLCLINIKDILERYTSQIAYIAVGSHDYCNIIECEHTSGNIQYLRLKLLSICKAYQIPIIDIVSTEIIDKKSLINDCIESFNMGFDGKALIHPNQLDVFNNAPYFSDEEIKEAIEVSKKLKEIDVNRFSVIKNNGKIFEKPHLKRINKIINWFNKKNAL